MCAIHHQKEKKSTMVTMDVDKLVEGSHPQSVATVSSIPPLKEIDELRYSRLIFTLGRAGMNSLCRSRVLVVGCKGLGAEVAKNLILSGVRVLGLVDDEVTCIADLGAQFLLTEADLGHNRAAATARKLKEFNPLADIVAVPSLGLENTVRNYTALVVTTGPMPFLIHLDSICRSHGVLFVAAISRGLFFSLFVDFGDTFLVSDDTGEPAGSILVEGITQEFPATVTVVEEQRHGLEDGDEVVLSGIKGMEELNRDAPYSVTVTGRHSFTIPVDSRPYGRYLSGGYFQKLKHERKLGFLSMENAIRSPEFCISDPVKSTRSLHLHVAFQAVDEFERRQCEQGSTLLPLSPSFKDAAVEEVLGLAREIWEQSGLGVRNSDCSNGFAVGEASEVVEEEGAIDGISPAERGVAESGLQEDGGESISSSALPTGSSLSGFPARMSGKRISIDEDIVRHLAQGAHVELSPIAAIAGGIAAQEIMKGITGVFTPLKQWLYFDAIECLPTSIPLPEERALCRSRYDLQTSLFGRLFQEKLGSLQWLVVGAGGLGCEVLKNMVLMGVGCSPDGCITVTDMDVVSKPNLTDQLLYQLEDVDRPKTPTAARALRAINPGAQIHALQERFEPETENIFDSSFFNAIAGVFSTVDTASSRVYLDMRCVANRTPMVDGGKHGTKGSVQVFIPFQSEMYSSTRDPPEHKEVPICTLKNFPYATDHVLRWAVDAFEMLFKQRPIDVNAYLSSRDFQESIRKSAPLSRLPILETLRDALLRHRPLSFEACVQWARFQFEDLFCNSIKQLCFNFPPGMTTTAGAPFWSGTKRAPTPLNFDPGNSLHLDFIMAAANLQATVYGLRGCQDRALFVDHLRSIAVPAFEPREGVKIAVTDNELRNTGSQQRRGRLSSEDTDAADACEQILQELPTPATLVGYRLTPIEFEKDDERNFHVEFVAAAANLRAQNYGIPATDKLEGLMLQSLPSPICLVETHITKLQRSLAASDHLKFLVPKTEKARLVGGRVTPSIVTSTAVVGGLMCLELYKLLQNKPLSDHKHAFFNLALPLFAFAEPFKAIQHTVARRQAAPLVWTLWDRFEMDCLGLTLEDFLAEFKRQQGLEITMLSFGKSLLYAEFLPRKKLQDRMPLSLVELVSVVGKVVLSTTESKITFSISCTDANDEDVEVPDVVARVR